MTNVLRSAASFFSGKLLPKISYPVIRGPLKGIKFILGAHGGSGGGATVYFNMIEPLQTQAFIKTIKKGDTIFDVGANVGYYTALGSILTGDQGRVFSFEPLARNISYLYRHVEINKLTNVTIIPSACSDSLSILKFIESSNTAMGRLENSEMAGSSDTKISIIPTVTLDAIADKIEGFPKVLKIDVEGAEVAVLKGAEKIISISKPAIFLSVHSQELRKACLDYLLTFNYRFEPLQEDSENCMEFLCI
ncbi:MAG: FkbM family methyltransferase [Ferruginibacter sp.]